MVGWCAMMGQIDMTTLRLPRVRMAARAKERDFAAEIDALQKQAAQFGVRLRKATSNATALQSRVLYLEGRLKKLASVEGSALAAVCQSMDDLLPKAAAIYQIDPALILQRNKTRYVVRARKVFCAMSRDAGYSMRDIAAFLGPGADKSTVSKHARAGDALLEIWQDGAHE